MKLKKIFLLLTNKNILFPGIIVGILLFLFTYATSLFLQSDGYSVFEMITLTLLPGIYFILLGIAFYIYHLNKYIKESLKAKVIPQKRIIQMVLVFLLSVFIYFAIDILVFMVDDSVSYDFAKTLSTIPSDNKFTQEEMQEFANEPFSVQTGILTTILGAMGALFSLIFIKKDGNIISKSDYNSL